MIIKIGDKTGSAQIDTMGAQLISLQNASGMEYLWQGDPMYWNGRAPILFPIVGELRNERTMINGREYNMKRHGFARRMEFAKLSSTPSSAVFSLQASEQTQNQYPFEFVLMVTYRFHESALITEFNVTNLGKEPMPFVIGGHPAFNCPLSNDECFEDWAVEFEQNETADCPQFDLEKRIISFQKRISILKNEKTILLQHSLFNQDALVFDSLKSKKIKLYSRKSGQGVEMDFADFPYLGIWSAANNAPFVALEPWTGCDTAEDEDDNFLGKRGMKLLQPQQNAVNSFTVTML